MEERRVRGGGSSYLLATDGSGPPVLLLHGFPQTHHCWRKVLPRLAGSFTVVAPDLRGYGDTVAPPGGPKGEGYSKREMAAELLGLMKQLGFERFAVVGHDRGGRVAYRDRKSTRLNSSHLGISYAVFCLQKKKTEESVRKRNEATGDTREPEPKVYHGNRPTEQGTRPHGPDTRTRS